MARLLIALAAGLVVGGIVTWLVIEPAAPVAPAADELVRDIVKDTAMPAAVAEQHREQRYTQLATIEDVYALPTEFARTEALYALAGRSDPAAVQALIFEANRIADDVERTAALEVLFFRLAELDPASALALGRTEYFSGVKRIEQTIWKAWARKDFEAALFAAGTQRSPRYRNLAAQSLYHAFGYMGNATTERIEAELGIGPDRNTRGRFLYAMADRSTAEAIAYINGMPVGIEQQELVSWLAYYVSLGDPQGALAYADLFNHAGHARQYRNIIERNAARSNPAATIERVLAEGQNIQNNGEFHSAMRSLASADLDAAMRYFEQAGSAEDRQTIGAIVVAAIAARDPEQALEFAREFGRTGADFNYRSIEVAALRTIARSDPERAFAEAQNLLSGENRRHVLSLLVSNVAQERPQEAIKYLDLIENAGERREAEQQLAQNWLRNDAVAAIDWILSQDEERAAEILQSSSWSLMRGNLDVAIRVLPKLDETRQVSWRQQIAQRLAVSRSPAEAQNFIRQFETEPGYAQLQASVISGVAETDAALARQMASQLADTTARDRAYAAVVTRRAQVDPREAAAWAGEISDESYRGTAMGQIASTWYESDPEAANQWVAGLPAGGTRDDAIMHLAARWSDPSEEQLGLIAGIADDGKRGQATVRMIYNIVRVDPVRARQMLEQASLPDFQRQQVERHLDRMRGRF